MGGGQVAAGEPHTGTGLDSAPRGLSDPAPAPTCGYAFGELDGSSGSVTDSWVDAMSNFQFSKYLRLHKIFWSCWSGAGEISVCLLKM